MLSRIQTVASSRSDQKTNSSKVQSYLERGKSLLPAAFMCYRGFMGSRLCTQASYALGILKVQNVIRRSFSVLGKVVEN